VKQFKIERKSIRLMDGTSRDVRAFSSPSYNYVFDDKTGFFARWGATPDEDPEYSLFGPEIADIEITTACAGMSKGGNCRFCYKSVGPRGSYMPLETFERALDKVNENGQLTQVALGADASCSSNPDIWDIMRACRKRGIVPNITVAEIDDKTADKLAELCGAVAVSLHLSTRYFRRSKNEEEWKEISEAAYLKDDSCEYRKEVFGWEPFINSVYSLTSRGMEQVNCHVVVHEESYDDIIELFHRRMTDPMLSGLRAIVLLGLKKCGRAKDGPFTSMSLSRFESLVRLAMDTGIGIGFDSCSCSAFLRTIDKIQPDNLEELKQLAEPCESGLFSVYLNVEGKVFPCSFNETTGIPGFDVVNCKSFITQYWNDANASNGWRHKLLRNKRNCPTYQIYAE
jgi:MoaA/NifB/PqqE/SkfB family radical SAM enzyme